MRVTLALLEEATHSQPRRCKDADPSSGTAPRIVWTLAGGIVRCAASKTLEKRNGVSRKGRHTSQRSVGGERASVGRNRRSHG